MFSGWGKSRNYRISGGGPTLTDVLVVFYCFLQSVPIDHSKGTKNSKEGGLDSPIFFICFVGFWFFTSHHQSFSYKGTGLPGLNQY